MFEPVVIEVELLLPGGLDEVGETDLGKVLSHQGLGLLNTCPWV